MRWVSACFIKNIFSFPSFLCFLFLQQSTTLYYLYVLPVPAASNCIILCEFYMFYVLMYRISNSISEKKKKNHRMYLISTLVQCLHSGSFSTSLIISHVTSTTAPLSSLNTPVRAQRCVNEGEQSMMWPRGPAFTHHVHFPDNTHTKVNVS